MAVFYNDPGDLLPCPEKHTLVTVAFRGDNGRGGRYSCSQKYLNA